MAQRSRKPPEAGGGSPNAQFRDEATAAPQPPPRPTPADPADRGKLYIAFLLAAAAVAAAVVGTHVSMLSGEAGGKWQSTVRLEVKRSTSVEESVRYIYDDEMVVGVKILETRLVLAQLAALPNPTAAALIEEGVLTESLEVLEHNFDLATEKYGLPSGGIDLSKRLTDLRAENPDMLSIDPLAVQAEGDRIADKAARLSLALIPFGLTAMLGALAQAFAPRRRVLLGSGVVALALGLIVALAVEVLA